MTEIYVDSVSVLVTREQLDWLNAQVGPGQERGSTIRNLIVEEMQHQAMQRMTHMEIAE